jgi:STE24 endopeptidase
MQGSAPTEALRWFTPQEVERAHRYHEPLHRLLVADLALSLGLLAALSFSVAGDWLDDRLGGLPWWGETLAFCALVLAVSNAIRLPASAWRWLVHERRYGLSTQTTRGFAADRAKGLAVSVTLTSASLLGLVGLARALPRAWPAPAAAGAALLVVLAGFAAPVLLEPLFNRFRPLAEPELAEALRALARRAGVPVREVLVADASRRTRRLNAYVSGFGRTRRIVLYDTLLENADRDELVLVTAHELAHARERHVLKGTALGALGAALGVLAVWALLSSEPVLASIGASGASDPRVVPFVLLVFSGLELLASPLASALSRSFERLADRVSLELGGSREAYVRLHLDLARSNLADLDPPRAFYFLFASHPTPPERLAARG